MFVSVVLPPPPHSHSPAPDNIDNLLIRWCCSCCDLFVVVVAFLFVPFSLPRFPLRKVIKPPAEKHGFKPLFWKEKESYGYLRKARNTSCKKMAQCFWSEACSSCVVWWGSLAEAGKAQTQGAIVSFGSPGCAVWQYCSVVLGSLWRGRAHLVLIWNQRFFILGVQDETDFFYFQPWSCRRSNCSSVCEFKWKVDPHLSYSSRFLVLCSEPLPPPFCDPNSSPSPWSIHLL